MTEKDNRDVGFFIFIFIIWVAILFFDLIPNNFEKIQASGETDTTVPLQDVLEHSR